MGIKNIISKIARFAAWFFCITTAFCVVALIVWFALDGSTHSFGTIVGGVVFLVPMLGFSIGLFLRLRRGKKQEKAAKVSDYSEEYDFEDEYTFEEPDAETLERKKRAAGISKNALTYHLKYTDTAGKKTSRNIEIVRVFKNNEHLYFYAFCHIALKVLMFRADRIDELLFDGSPINNPSQLLADMVQE